MYQGEAVSDCRRIIQVFSIMRYLAFGIANKLGHTSKKGLLVWFCLIALLLSSCEKEVIAGLDIRLQKSISAVSLPVQKTKKKQVQAHRRKIEQKDSIRAIQDSIDLNRSRMVFTFVSYGG
jgi:hypothetical protein